MADGIGGSAGRAATAELAATAGSATTAEAAALAEPVFNADAPAPAGSKRAARMERRRERDRLEDEIMTLAAEIDAAIHRFLTLLREFDERNGWVVDGVRSFADWLSWKTGLTLGVAREKVRVAKALAELPEIDDGLRRGTISYSKARALTRVATPENEATLAEMAVNTSAAQLEKICRGVRQVQRNDEAGQRSDIPPERYVRQRLTDDGMIRITIQVHPDEAEWITQAIEAMRSRLHEEQVASVRGGSDVELAPSAQAVSGETSV